MHDFDYVTNFKTDLPPTQLKYFKRFVEKLPDHPIADVPSPHMVLTDVFEPEHYDLLRESLFDAEDMQQFSASYPSRSTIRLNRKVPWVHSQQPRKRLWFEIIHELSGAKFNQEAFSSFNSVLDQNVEAQRQLTEIGQVRLISKTYIMKDGPSYALGPHRDHDDKFLTILFYLPPWGSKHLRGTSFFQPKSKDHEFSDDGHQSFEEFDHLFEVPFEANSALMFLRTKDSFHGVLPKAQATGVRDLLIHNLHLRL